MLPAGPTNLAGNPETPGHLLLPLALEITCSLVEAFLCKAVCGTSARSPPTRIFHVTEPFGSDDYQWLPGRGATGLLCLPCLRLSWFPASKNLLIFTRTETNSQAAAGALKTLAVFPI